MSARSSQEPDFRGSKAEVRSIHPARKEVMALHLVGHQAGHVQPGQGRGAARAPDLQGLKLTESLIKPPGEMCFIAGHFLQSLLVGKQALSGHIPKVSLYLLSLKLGSFGLPLGASDGSFQQLFRLFVSSFGYLLYDRTPKPARRGRGL